MVNINVFIDSYLDKVVFEKQASKSMTSLAYLGGVRNSFELELITLSYT